MPTGNENNSQIFFEIDGELKPSKIGVSLEDCEDIVYDVENMINSAEYFKGGEIAFKISQKEYKRLRKVMQSVFPRCYTNNWRKMHYLPMIRRRGKRNEIN